MFLRALLAFLVLPGVAAFAAPIAIGGFDPWRHGYWAPGLIVMAVGAVLLLWCVRDFYVSGKGTLAPWDPPKNIVVIGLYRYVRSPMYLGVLTLSLGWAAFLTSWLVAGYTLCLWLGFHIQVLTHEEPWLARTFPDTWPTYKAAVPRWIPRMTPWKST